MQGINKSTLKYFFAYTHSLGILGRVSMAASERFETWFFYRSVNVRKVTNFELVEGRSCMKFCFFFCLFAVVF